MVASLAGKVRSEPWGVNEGMAKRWMAKKEQENAEETERDDYQKGYKENNEKDYD